MNRQRVIAAARDLFATRGLEATLNEVAHHAGLGVATVYRRFPTKDSLFDAIFKDGIEQLASLAGSALERENSWEAFTWFIDTMCGITATDRGMREIIFSKTYGGGRVEAARLRLTPELTKLIERAQADGYLRPELSATDVPFFGLLAGTVSEYAGHAEPGLWRRYIAMLVDSMRVRADQPALQVDALNHEQLEAVMRAWRPAASS